MLNIVNQELVKAVKINLCYNHIATTNFNIEKKVVRFTFKEQKDHIVISFDKNMNTDQCWEYLNSMKGKIVEKFCGSESAIDLSFDKEFFPFNLNKGKLKAHENKHKYSVPIEEGVIFNLKCLLANGLTLDTTRDMGEKFGEEYAETHISSGKFKRESYLCCICFHDEDLQDYFIENFSSKVKGYVNSLDDFLEIKGDSVYIKKGIFDNLEFIKEVQEDDVCSITYDFQNTELQDTKDFKDTMIDFINHKSGVSICATHLTPFGLIVPMTQDGRESLRILNKSEVDRVNTAFKMEILSSIKKDDLPEEVSIDGGVYTIDFANPEISFSIVGGIMQNSVINKDYKLSIDPACLRAMQLPSQQTLALPEVERDRVSGDSGFADSPKDHTIHAKNSTKLLSPNYYDEGGQGTKDDTSARDSGICVSSARSSFNKLKTTVNQCSLEQCESTPDQHPVKRTSISKKLSCCIL